MSSVRPHPPWLFAASVVVILGSAVLRAQTVSKFDGPSLPSAPRQSEVWSAPQSEIPTDAVAAITSLFDQGLADPRGCEYRQIEVATGSCWGSVVAQFEK